MKVLAVLLVAWCLWLTLSIYRLDDSYRSFVDSHNRLVGVVERIIRG